MNKFHFEFSSKNIVVVYFSLLFVVVVVLFDFPPFCTDNLHISNEYNNNFGNGDVVLKSRIVSKTRGGGGPIFCQQQS